jgi:hypothetical protein
MEQLHLEADVKRSFYLRIASIAGGEVVSPPMTQIGNRSLTLNQRTGKINILMSFLFSLLKILLLA